MASSQVNRRVGIISTASHFIAFGGAGQFIKGIWENVLKPQGYIVDLICDKPPADQDFLKALGFNGQVFTPDSPLPYTKHTALFSFSDGPNLEKEINLRDALFKALSTNIYDTLIVNSIEGIATVTMMGIQRYIKTVVYTHVEFSIGLLDHKLTPFSQDFIHHYGRLINTPDLIIGTQSQHNAFEIHRVHGASPRVLPMLLPEADLLNAKPIPKAGILFNGRWEPRKRPEEFVALIKETGLPAKVMTGPRGVAKFEAAFKEAGITNYTIRSGIFGQEKVDFIASARLVYHPSRHENFSFSCLEGMAQCPVVVDGDCYWHKNFKSEGFNLIPTTKKDRADVVKRLYYLPVTEAQTVIARDYHERGTAAWSDFLQEDHPHKAGKCKFTEGADNGFYGAYLQALGRPVSIEDVHNAHKNKDHFQRQQLPEGTFLSTTGQQAPSKAEEQSFWGMWIRP